MKETQVQPELQYKGDLLRGAYISGIKNKNILQMWQVDRGKLPSTRETDVIKLLTFASEPQC